MGSKRKIQALATLAFLGLAVNTAWAPLRQIYDHEYLLSTPAGYIEVCDWTEEGEPFPAKTYTHLLIGPWRLRVSGPASVWRWIAPLLGLTPLLMGAALVFGTTHKYKTFRKAVAFGIFGLYYGAALIFIGYINWGLTATVDLARLSASPVGFLSIKAGPIYWLVIGILIALHSKPTAIRCLALLVVLHLSGILLFLAIDLWRFYEDLHTVIFLSYDPWMKPWIALWLLLYALGLGTTLGCIALRLRSLRTEKKKANLPHNPDASL